MSIINNLYPPIIDTYTPAFKVLWKTYDVKRNNEIVAQNVTGYMGVCKIYFSLSPLNDFNEIESAWVSIVDPRTNKTVLNNATGFVKYSKEYIHLDGDRYYVSLSQKYLIDYKWELDTTYKIQIRFCSKDITNSMSAIVKNSDYFSEWSTASLVKPVNGCQVSLDYLLYNQKDDYYSFNIYQNTISGNISYNQSDNEGEFLESYQIKIYDTNSEFLKQNLILDSEMLSTNETDANVFKYKLTKGLNPGRYLFIISFISNNLFYYEKKIKVEVEDKEKGFLYAQLTAEPDTERGSIKVKIKIPANKTPYVGNFILRRSSSESNFTYWEDLKIFQFNYNDAEANDIIVTWEDFSAESGVLYKYYLTRLLKTKENRYASITEEPVLLQLDDMFLTGGGRNLKIKFNPTINSYQYTLSETSTQTIGGKYPFIKRNGNLFYRQIGISGLISFQLERNERKNLKTDIEEEYFNLFTSKTELLNGYDSFYKKYNEKNDIHDFNDFTLERKFREKVLEFLLDGKVKLFRSASEGAALVRLMNVSLTPTPTLGRLVYSFSATGYEIADYTLENISKYKIQEIGVYQDIVQEEKYIQPFALTEQQSGLIDYFEDENSINDMLKLLKTDKSTYNAQWEKNFLYSETTTIQLYSDSALTIPATPYKIAQQNEDFSIDLNGTENGFIFYYKEYDVNNVNTTMHMVVSSEPTYTFNLNTPLSFLSFAVPKEQKIFAKITGTEVGFLSAVEEQFMVGEGE